MSGLELPRALRRRVALQAARDGRKAGEARPRDHDRLWLGVAKVSGASIGETHAEARRRKRRERDERLTRRFAP